MEFSSQQELYNKLLPAFKVKKRLLIYSKHPDITNKDIWCYLIDNKWKKCHNLTLSDIVNDIITFDIEEIPKKTIHT